MTGSRSLFLLLLCGSSALAQVPVVVAPLGDQLVQLEVRAPATVVAANRAIVAAQVSALITEVLADVGATVAKGDVLIRLDDADASLALKSAEAQLKALDAQIAQAAQQLKRGEELIASNYISDDELLVRRTNVAVLQANRAAQVVAVDSARIALSRTRVRAPFEAAVIARAAQVGSLAQPGSPLLTLVQISNREIDAELDPRYATSIAGAGNLRFESQGAVYRTSLARLSPVIDTDTRTQRGRFLFTGDAAPIGATGEVIWQDAAGLIPVPLIVQRDGKLGVFIAENGRARFVALAMAQEGRPAPSQLPPETPVVVSGQSRLQDNDALSIQQQ
ncbi:MAG: efflux RND transporter periplasmic adaptor subunit [Woeseia sp.]